MLPPCPTFSIDITVPQDGSEPDVSALPNRPGVFAFENDAGQTICLAVTANLRRLVKSRLTVVEATEDGKPSRHVNYRAATRRVKALPVASSFEADWAYLQLARRLMPHAAKSLTDRWRGWFVHVDPDARFPRFVKTSTPGKPPTGMNGIYLGPINDKHAAARFMDAMIAGFDLCRYYHILIESPNGNACAYKEMGRCPAPCDGTVSMAHYHQQMRDAVDCAADRDAWKTTTTKNMSEASDALNFETAELCKRQIADVEPAMKPAFDYVDRLDRFCWLALTLSEKTGWIRIILMCGGWIAPFVDVTVDSGPKQLNDIAVAIDRCRRAHPVRMEESDIENIGLVCTHFFRKRKANQPQMVFVKVADGCDVEQLRKAMKSIERRLRRTTSAADETDEKEGDSDVSEQAIESIEGV